MIRTLSYASLFVWILSPLALYGANTVFGTPHIIQSYTFSTSGSRYDPFADRHYFDCTYWGATGTHTVSARAGKCGWVRFIK
jgi:hypothetical protein